MRGRVFAPSSYAQPRLPAFRVPMPRLPAFPPRLPAFEPPIEPVPGSDWLSRMLARAVAASAAERAPKPWELPDDPAWPTFDLLPARARLLVDRITRPRPHVGVRVRWWLHNLVAHPLLVLAPPLGERLHDATIPDGEDR